MAVFYSFISYLLLYLDKVFAAVFGLLVFSRIFELGLIFRQALNFPCISVLVGTCFSFMIFPLILPLHFLLTAVYLARVLQQFSSLLVYSRRFSVG